MKKVLVSLLVLALATTGVFAAVDITGQFVAGYNFNYNNGGNEKWEAHMMGQDGDDTNSTKLNVGVADENGVWSLGFESNFVADGRLSGDISVDMMKLFDAESDISLKLGLNVNDEQAILRAYSNQSGNNFDRFRTPAPGLWTNLLFAYGDLVQVQVAGAPAMVKGYTSDGKTNGDDTQFGQFVNPEANFTVSALVKPLDGLAVSAGYVYQAKDDDGVGTDGVVGGAVDVNVGTLAGLDFDLGVSASYKYGFANKQNVLAATVYGGVDVVDVAIEYALKGSENFDHYLYAGVNLNVVENMILDVYIGANNLPKFADTFFVGGDIGYTVKNVTFQLGLEYAGTGVGGAAYNYDYTGLSIVPQIKVAF